jgi:hypothetical protein
VTKRQGNHQHDLVSAPLRPWRVDVVVEFADQRRAIAFERYLKTGSGSVFARRHFR